MSMAQPPHHDETADGSSDAPPTSPVRLRPDVDALPDYIPGARPGGSPAYKLSSNENPFPPLPSVQAAIAAQLGEVNRYPDMACTELVAALAGRFDVAENQVAVGAGSVAVLAHCLQAVVGAGDEVVYAWRSFESYPITVGLLGGRSVRVPLTPDGRHDLPAMAAAVSDRTRAVLICSPNNPTGPAVHADELTQFLDSIPRDVLVIVDEAYVEFVRDPLTFDSLELRRRYPQVVVLRTFSKAYGLAGLRVGFALGEAPIIAAARKATTPFGISSLAQTAAVASLAPEAEAELLQRVEAIVRRRTRLVAGLARQGWFIPDPQGNFVYLALGEQTAEAARVARELGIIVRPFVGEGLRISVGESESIDRVLDVTSELAARYR